MSRYPDPSSVNWSAGLQEAPKYINEVTNGIVMNFVLLAIAVIVGSSYWFTKRDLPGALAVGSFCAWIIGFLFWLADFVGDYSFVFLTAVMIASVSYVIVSANQNG